MAFADLVTKIDNAVLRVFGQDATFTPRLGTPYTVRVAPYPKAEPEETRAAGSVYLVYFARAAAFTAAPNKGEEITIGNTVYTIVDIDADEEGGLRLRLHFARVIIT